MSSFGEVLAEFKKKESPISIAPLMDDNKLVCGLAAWQSVAIQLNPATECKETDPFKKWLWLWEQCEPDLETFAIVSAVKGQDADPLFTRLKGLKLIYPDGTIHQLALQFIQALVLDKLPRQKRPKEDGNITA